jgi:hypothetical protein
VSVEKGELYARLRQMVNKESCLECRDDWKCVWKANHEWIGILDEAKDDMLKRLENWREDTEYFPTELHAFAARDTEWAEWFEEWFGEFIWLGNEYVRAQMETYKQKVERLEKRIAELERERTGPQSHANSKS